MASKWVGSTSYHTHFPIRAVKRAYRKVVTRRPRAVPSGRSVDYYVLDGSTPELAAEALGADARVARDSKRKPRLQILAPVHGIEITLRSPGLEYMVAPI